MDNDKKGVKTEDQDALTGEEAEVETEGSDASTEQEDATIDYKAVAAELEARLIKSEEEKENYKKGLLSKKKIEKSKKKEETKDDDLEEEEDELDARVEKKLSQFKADIVKGTVESTVSKLTSDPDKKKLILHYYENSIVKSGIDPVSVQEDLENALLIVDKKVLLKKVSELGVALKNKSGGGSMSSGSTEGEGSKGKTFFSDTQIKEFKRKGYDDAKIKRIELNMRKSK